MKAGLHKFLLLIDEVTRAAGAVGGSTGTVPGLGMELLGCARAGTAPPVPLPTAAPSCTSVLGPGAVRNLNSWDSAPCCWRYLYIQGDAWLICVAGFAMCLA